MAYFDDPTTDDPSLDPDAQQQLLDTQAARIKALRNFQAPDAPAQLPGFRSAVTGGTVLAPYIKPSLLGQLSPIAADWTANQQTQELAGEQSNLNAANQQRLAQFIANRPQGTPATDATPDIPAVGPTPAMPEVPSQITYDASGNPTTVPTVPATAGSPGTPMIPGKAGTPYTPPTTQDILGWAASGANQGPLVKSLAQKEIEDQMIQAPIRQQAQQAALAKAKMEIQAQQQTKQLQLQQQSYEAEQNRLSREQIAQNARDAALIASQGQGEVKSDQWGNASVIHQRTGQSVPVEDPMNPGFQLQTAPTGPGADAVKTSMEGRAQAAKGMNAAMQIQAILTRNPTAGWAGGLKEKTMNLANMSNQDIIDAQSLDSLSKQLTESMPRFTGGRQTNFDVGLYQSGAGNMNNRDTAGESRLGVLKQAVIPALQWGLDAKNYGGYAESQPRRMPGTGGAAPVGGGAAPTGGGAAPAAASPSSWGAPQSIGGGMTMTRIN